MKNAEQLARLRQTIGVIDRKYPARPPEPPTKGFIEGLLPGEVVETPHGKHFEKETLYPRNQRYGSYDISDLIELPHDLLYSLSKGAIPAAAPTKWAFVDTETTGLSGGSGTCAFLIGLGSIDSEGFRVRQFFMRDYNEEHSMLHSLAEHLTRFDVLITYNGKSFDQPILEARYTLCRSRRPFAVMRHVDLLHSARRLYKLRLKSCRLVNLERQILGFDREGDVPGEMIPYYYFEFLRTRQAFRLIPIFHHNVLDIVTLACLTDLISVAFRDPAAIKTRYGADLLGLARWLRDSQRLEEALSLMLRAVEIGLADQHLFPALFEVGVLEKKLGLADAAIAIFTDLTLSPNPFRAKAYEELSKHYEHHERDHLKALECTRAARAIADSDPLVARQRRLEAKCAEPRLAFNESTEIASVSKA
jgi:uncharacterized protein YprB with RNaseH-like and TPR domain